MQINLDDALATQLEERVTQSDEFDTVESYVNYVLQEVIKQTAAESGAENDAFNKDEEAEVKQRLEDLGYLD